MMLLLFLSLSRSFLVESWFENLHHFGPLKTEGWAARAMTLVGDYAFVIRGIECVAGDQFMFVSKLQFASGTAPPPLGELNWKQGKIGVAALTRLADDGTTNETVWRADVLQGGAGGRYPVSGTFAVRVFTGGHASKPNVVELIVENAATETRLETSVGQFVIDNARRANIALRLLLSEPLARFVPAIVANRTSISGPARLAGAWRSVDNRTLEVDVTPSGDGLVLVSVGADIDDASAAGAIRTERSSLELLLTSNVFNDSTVRVARWVAETLR